MALSEQGIDDIFMISNLTDSTIDSLRYNIKDNEDTVTPVRLADKMLLHAFLHFVINTNMEGHTIVGESWNRNTQEEFDSLCIKAEYMAKMTTTAFSMPIAPPSSKTPPVTKQIPTYSPD
jgi:hypothetical protein